MARKKAKVRQTEPDPSAPRPNIKLPKGYDNESDFLQEMRELYEDDDSADFDNHKAGVEDMEFFTGKQWDPDVEQRRIAAKKPVLTVNRLPAFVGQVVGSRKMHETQIKVIPDNGGTIDVAKVREGLIRSIQKESKAGFAYDTAFLGQVVAGIGNFQLDLDYANDDVWDVEIRIKPITDHFAVVWDRTLTEPTGRDAKHAFLGEKMPIREFYERWPWATPADMQGVRFPGELTKSGWYSKADVRVVDYWRMRARSRTLALLRDGTTQDITDDDAGILAKVAQRPDGSPFIRQVNRPYAQKYICSGMDVLEGPYDLPIDRIPIFRVPGWEIRIGDAVFRWGLIRHMKDPQRLHNYWRSVMAEKIMRSPKTTWTASSAAVMGREAAWRASATSDDPLLIWNAESGQKPERVEPAQVEQALIQQAEITTQDLKDVSNIHEANLGMPSNEVSGVAINARVRVSDTGTAIYQENLGIAIEECGRVTNDLISVVYDTPRIIKVIGDDAKQLMQAINATGNPKSIDITLGKYSVTASSGPSYDTKRQESAQNMLGLATAMPQVLSVAADLIVEAQDWPGAEKIATRIRKTLPPQILSPDEMTPEVQAAAAGKAQQDQQAQQAAMAGETAKFLQTQSQAAMNFARAHNYIVQANTIPQKLQNESLTAASEATSRELHDNLDAIKV
jgi:hypothetical protein